MDKVTRTTFNPKRKLAKQGDSKQLESLARRVSYGGSPYHKKDPGDFGLTPPAQPRPDKTLCDEAGIFTIKEALRLLKEGVRRGLISANTQGKFPKNVWSVTEEGIPLEAQLENPEKGTYHGYPMPSTDDFRDEVLERWNQS